MKKRICLLLIVTLVFVMFFPGRIYAQESYQTSIVSPRGDQSKTVALFYPVDNNESYFLIQDSYTNILYFGINSKEEIKYVNAEDGLNLRHFPNTKYDNVVKTLPHGTKVKTIGEKNGWAVISENNKIYFCWNEYLSNDKPREQQIKAERSIEVEQQIEVEYTSAEFLYHGVVNWGGWRWTWYSQNVLPGGALDIPGRHADENGYICDENGFICLASGSLEKGTVVETPFGKKGKVYDCGCAADTLDVYTNF